MRIQMFMDIWPGMNPEAHHISASSRPGAKAPASRRVSFWVSIPDRVFYDVDHENMATTEGVEIDKPAATGGMLQGFPNHPGWAGKAADAADFAEQVVRVKKAAEQYGWRMAAGIPPLQNQQRQEPETDQVSNGDA